MSYFDTLKQSAIAIWHSHQVLPSICAAQASLESGSGTSRLAKEFNNHFGIKASADWKGRTVNMKTGEHVNGGRIEIYADFRAYDSIYDSIADYAAFFTGTPWRKENYKHVVGETDYKKAANALRAAGYATDPQYPAKLIRIIENNNLQAWDREALSSSSGSSPTVQATATQYDASKAGGATPISTSGWSLSEVNPFLMNSVDPPYVNGAYINKFLSTYYSDSPLIGQGDTIKDMADYYGISVGAAMGVWAKETTFGRSHPGTIDHNYGCIRHSSGWPSVVYNGSAWNKYPSKKVGIAAWFHLLRYNYIELGYHRYENFLNRYSPTSDDNVHSTFKNLMWGTLKSFGYNMGATATKFNHSKPSDHPSTVNPPRAGIVPGVGAGTGLSKPVNKRVGGQLTAAAEKYVRDNGASWIGDSLMVGTESHAKQMSPKSNFDGLGSRQITHATPSLNATQVLKNMINAGTLKNIIIFVIGTNRGVTRAEIDAVMALIGSERKIIFVSTASEVNHAAGVQGEYYSASERYPNAFFADWVVVARPKLSMYYTPDGAGGKRIHMTSEGYKAHADFLVAAWYEVATADYSQDIAEAAPVTYYDIEDFELTEDGIIKYSENTKPVTGADGKVTFVAEQKTHDTGIKGFFSPKGDKYVYYPESNNRWSHGGEAGVSTWIDTIYKNENTSSAIELIEGAIQELIDRSEPASQYTISLLDVDKTLSIGDYGVFIDHKYNPPLYIEARILSISTSMTDPTANTVVIGNVKELIQKENPEITALKAELQATRNEIKSDMQSQSPVTATIFSTNGLVLGDAFEETQLSVRLFQGTQEITEQYSDFKWERMSNDSKSDEAFNQLLEAETSSTIKVFNRDIANNQSVFVARVFSATGSLVKQAEVKLNFSDTAVWRDTEEEPKDAVDGSSWTKPDGTQLIKKDGEWEERVDQAKIGAIEQELLDAGERAKEAQDLANLLDQKVIDAQNKLGTDGTPAYNKNRADKHTAFTSSSKVKIGHNGEGFESGKSMVLSFKSSCVPFAQSSLTLNFTADDLLPPPLPKTKSSVILNLIEPGQSVPDDPVNPDIPDIPTPAESKFDGARVINLSDYGGIGNADADNFNALKLAMNVSATEPVILEIDEGVYHVQGGTNDRIQMEPWESAQSKGLRIVGKGNVSIRHKNNRTVNRHEYWLMQIVMSPDSLGFEVENITIDGIRNPQEELFYTQTESNPVPNIPLTRGIATKGAHDVLYNNVTFKNMYGGYGILLEEYRNVNITNTTFDKVGGNDTQESFGMAIYLGGHTGDANVNIDNVHAQGMTTTRGLKLSWIGVVLENGTIQSSNPSVWMRDVNTTVNITNSSFMDYQSTFHVESMAGNVYWNVDNIETRASNYQIVAGVYGEYKESSNRVNMEMMPYGRLWGIVHGLWYTEAQEADDNVTGHNRMDMYNSTIDFISEPGFNPIPQAVAYGSNVKGYLHNTQLNNLPYKLVQNGSAILYDSVINLAQASAETRASLQTGMFSDVTKQSVEFNDTTVNSYGQHKNVVIGDTPDFVKNKGFVPPFIQLPISPPI